MKKLLRGLLIAFCVTIIRLQAGDSTSAARISKLEQEISTIKECRTLCRAGIELAGSFLEPIHLELENYQSMMSYYRKDRSNSPIKRKHFSEIAHGVVLSEHAFFMPVFAPIHRLQRKREHWEQQRDKYMREDCSLARKQVACVKKIKKLQGLTLQNDLLAAFSAIDLS